MPVFIKASGGGYVCDQVSSLAAQVGFATAGTAILTWTKPTDVNFKGMVIRYKTGGYPTSPTDGTNAYDSNDAVPVNTITVTGLCDGTLYYFRAFAYCYEGATRVYNDQTTGAQISATPMQLKGLQTFTSSGSFTVPAGVTKIDVFAVGGGGGGGGGFGSAGSSSAFGGGGGGGGYTKTQKNISVTPGQTISFTVGSGGAGGSTISQINGGNNLAGNGGASSVTVNGVTYTANGGLGGGSNGGFNRGGGDGGSGGGMGGHDYYNPGAGGSNGSAGGWYETSSEQATGQGTTTRAFEDASLSLYSGGGGGGDAYYSQSQYPDGGLGGSGGGGTGGGRNSSGGIYAAAAGTNGTGGGGGGGACVNGGGCYNGANGGSGAVQIRWGY